MINLMLILQTNILDKINEIVININKFLSYEVIEKFHITRTDIIIIFIFIAYLVFVLINKERRAILLDKFRWYRVLKYIFGMVFIALGVVLVLKSDLGNSTWDTLHYALSELLQITIGTATIVVAMIFVVLVIVMNKSLKYLFMCIPILVVGPLIDIFNDVIFVNLLPTMFIQQLLLFLLGLLILPLGGALLIISTYPAGVFDEFMLAIMRITKSDNLVKIRVIMEVSAVTAALIIGLLAGIGRGKIYYGTIVFALSMGPIIKIYLKALERIGLSENKQND